MLETIKSKVNNFVNQLKDKQVVVLCGGFCSEREVSLNSGKEVYKALKEANISVSKYEVTNDITSLWKLLIEIKDNSIIFNALHGTFGEDGTLAAILDSLNIPYTHSGVEASALAMNKYLTKNIAKSCDIYVAKGMLFDTSEELNMKNLSYPLIMKPNTNSTEQ